MHAMTASLSHVNMCSVYYDDGDVEEVILADETYQFQTSNTSTGMHKDVHMSAWEMYLLLQSKTMTPF